jgi:uncharacterized protein YgfB (UPF0149 family)
MEIALSMNFFFIDHFKMSTFSMHTNSHPISFPACDAAMRRCGLTFSPAEAQGIAVGLLSSAQQDPGPVWQIELYTDFDPADGLAQECRALLDKLYDAAAAQLADPGFELHLFLPDAAAGLTALALRDWAQGFLFGFGLAGESLSAALSSEGQELLSDLYGIAQLDIEAIAEGDDTQEALVEIEEYLKLAALSLHAEQHTNP